jgi:hypothetical protein
MDPEIIDRWDDYHRAVRSIYVRTDRGLEFVGDDDLEEGSLVEIATRSSALTYAMGEELANRGSSDAEELETATLAAAAIDLAVAADVLTALRWEAEDLLRGDEPSESEPVKVVVPSAVEQAIPRQAELDSIGELLLRADDAFPQGEAVAGAAPGSSLAERRAEEAIDDLLGSAAPVATMFGIGLLTVGGSDLLGPMGGFEGIDGIADRVGHRLGYALRLIANGVRKVTAIFGSDCILDARTHLSLEQVVDALETRTGVGEWVVRRAVGTESSERKVRDILQNRHVDILKLDADLADLCRRYSKNMRWVKVFARRVKLCAPIVILLGAGPPGSVVIAGANGIGLTYSLLSVADRLDSLPEFIARVSGVPTIVDEA